MLQENLSNSTNKGIDNYQNPWAGLSSYEDPAYSKRKLLFCGRDNESYDVARLIIDNVFVTLYGKSGIGKTSLLNAGVFPELREEQFTPVRIRLGMQDEKNPKSFQSIIVEAIEHMLGKIETTDVIISQQLDENAIDFLWNYFIRHIFYNKSEKETIPVIVLDQFEEVLRSNKEAAEILLRQIDYINDKDHILENHTTNSIYYRYKTNYRFVVSIREDDLYRLEDSIDKSYLPALKRCRYRLCSLSAKDARDVIQIPGKKYIDATQLDLISDTIINEIKENEQVSSLMLSLTCNQLYNELKDGEKITLNMVEKQGINSSLKRFYKKTIAYLEHEQRISFEKILVENGHRKPISLKQYKKEVPDGLCLLEADKMRILTKIELSSANDDEHTFVELAHDRLAQIIEQIKNEKESSTSKQVFESDKQKIELPIIDGKKDVFISYKRESVVFVARLFKELENHDINAWFDMNDLHQYFGEEYTERIRKGIDNSEYFLLIYTKDIEDSDFIVNEELKYAAEKNKTILFFPKDKIDIKNSKLKKYVERIQWLDTEATAMHQSDTQETIIDEKHLAMLSSLVNKNESALVLEDQSIFLIRIALQKLLGKITVFGNYKKICGTGTDEFYDNNDISLLVINKALFITPPDKYKNRLEELSFFRKDRFQEVERHLERIKPDTNELLEKFKSFLNKNEDVYSLPILHRTLNKILSNRSISIKTPPIEVFDIQYFIDIVSEMVACSFISDLEKGKVMFNGTELGVYSITDSRTINTENHCIDMELYYSDYFTFKCMTEMYHILCSIDEKPFIINTTQDIKPLAPFLCSLGLGGFLVSYVQGIPSLMWTKRSGNISSGDLWHFSFDETVSLLLDGEKDMFGRLIVDKENCVRIDANKILLRALKEEIGVSRSIIEEEKYGLFEIGLIQSERLEIELISQATIHLKETSTPEEQIKQMHDSANDGYLEISTMKFLPLRNRNDLTGKLLTPESYAIYTRMQNRLVEHVGKKVTIGYNLLLDASSFIDDGAIIGDNCKIHRNVYIGKNVKIGNNVKIQNNNSIYEGVTLEDGVFVGTNVSFINDRYPRAITRKGQKVGLNDWNLEKTHVCYGASIGAGAVITCGVTIGKWAMVAAGSVVLEDVPEGAMVAGNPAKIVKTNINY